LDEVRFFDEMSKSAMGVGALVGTGRPRAGISARFLHHRGEGENPANPPV
jgi:hypothetical protein